MINFVLKMLTELSVDIHDIISYFLPNKDLVSFLCSSRYIMVSPYLLRDRQRKYWKKSGMTRLVQKGDFLGIQYLHSIGVKYN
jgi:hypothetical protein